LSNCERAKGGWHLPRVLIPIELLNADEPQAAGETARRLVRVLRLGAGDAFTAMDGGGLEYDCRILSASPKLVHFVVEESRQLTTEPRLELTIAQAVPKGSRMEFVIQKCVELGVARIVPLLTERGIVRHADELDADFDDEPGQRERRWAQVAISAAEQSGRGRVPAVTRPLSLGAALTAMGEADLFILDERERECSLVHALRGAENPMTRVGVFIGPEGGFTVGEIEQAIGFGAQPVTLGPRILRTETAGIVACTIVMALAGELEFR